MTERTPLENDPHAKSRGAGGVADASGVVAEDALEREVRRLRSALAAADVRERALTYELQHRVRNMLAVIRTIYRRMLASATSHDQFPLHFEDRLDAIGRYQADIAGVSAGGIELEDMVRDELLNVHCTDGPNCTISGPSVRLSAKWLELMGLALHELATNAVKFGALCHDGALHIEWWLVEEGAQSILHFHWKESGAGLLTTVPRTRGFGQDLIEEALPYQFGATTSFEFTPRGLECAIILPLPSQTDPVAWLHIDQSGTLGVGDDDNLG